MAKTHQQKLFGAAVLKTSFRLREALDSPAFKVVYPGVLRDLDLEETEVDEYIAANREAVEKAARGQPG
jgi:hypothetical protein